MMLKNAAGRECRDPVEAPPNAPTKNPATSGPEARSWKMENLAPVVRLRR
jgi:hypothetical protein